MKLAQALLNQILNVNALPGLQYGAEGNSATPRMFLLSPWCVADSICPSDPPSLLRVHQWWFWSHILAVPPPSHVVDAFYIIHK